MNSCEKKELKAVLQKLSDKLEGKMVGGGSISPMQARADDAFQKDMLALKPGKSLVDVNTVDKVIYYPDRLIIFLFEYGEEVDWLVHINQNLPNFGAIYNSKIMNLTINDTLLTITTTNNNNPYKYEGNYDNSNGTFTTADQGVVLSVVDENWSKTLLPNVNFSITFSEGKMVGGGGKNCSAYTGRYNRLHSLQ